MTIETVTPDFGRQASLSALDFVYWAMTAIDVSMQHGDSTRPFEGLEEDNVLCMQLLNYSAGQVGIDLPLSLEELVAHINQYEMKITATEAFRLRGALLIRNRGVGISMGDDRRIIETKNSTYMVRYLLESERNDGFWFAAKIPAMEYL